MEMHKYEAEAERLFIWSSWAVPMGMALLLTAGLGDVPRWVWWAGTTGVLSPLVWGGIFFVRLALAISKIVRTIFATYRGGHE